MNVLLHNYYCLSKIGNIKIAPFEDDHTLDDLIEKSKTEGQVDYDALCSKKEYLDVLELIKVINTKNTE